MNQITRLTQQKADAIAAKGYAVTGYVLTSPEGKKAIVDCQAVRWLDQAKPKNPVLHTQILTLRKYQAWRTGEDERTMDEAGIVPAAITSALDAVLEVAESHAKYLDLATELWAAAQTAPGEGIEDAEDRIAAILAGSWQCECQRKAKAVIESEREL